MKIGLQLPSSTRPGGPAELGASEPAVPATELAPSVPAGR
jgi:hypothetical protein